MLFAVEKKQILQRFCNSFWTLGDYKLAWNVWRHTHIFIFEFYLNTKFYKLDFPYAFEAGEEVQGGAQIFAVRLLERVKIYEILTA